MQMDSHSNLLQQAKEHQKLALTESDRLSHQLRLLLDTLIKSNSLNDYNGSSVLDKITTIHEIDREIDKQLNQDIAINYEKLLDSKQTLSKIMNKSYKNMSHGPDGNIIDHLQRRSEIIDQDLRILDQTLKIIKENE